jgi:D-alanine-D-alanine ligase
MSIKVAVIRGGPSNAYSDSLKTGGHILSTLREMLDVYEPVDIFISREGEWHREGLVEEPHRALKHIDVVWNALHGRYGEDGQVQRVLEGLKIPFTGSSAVASALSMDKDMTKRIYRRCSLLTPEHELITEGDDNEEKLVTIFRNYLFPVIVKPANASNSLGVRLVHTFHEFKQAVKDTFKHSPKVMVEEFIKGDEVTCVVMDGANGEKIYALLPVSKSGNLKTEENKRIEEMAKRAHEALGLRHYSGSDFMITPRKKIYILETNSLPAIHPESIVYHTLSSTDWHSREFVDHILKLTV